MRFKCHIDGVPTCRSGIIGGQNLTLDSRTARTPGEFPTSLPPPSLPLSPGEGRYGLCRAVLPPVSVTDDVV